MRMRFLVATRLRDLTGYRYADTKEEIFSSPIKEEEVLFVVSEDNDVVSNEKIVGVLQEKLRQEAQKRGITIHGL